MKSELNWDSDVRAVGVIQERRSPSLKILSCASAAMRCLRWLLPSVSSERWWSRNATRGDNADTSVCENPRVKFTGFFFLGEIQASNRSIQLGIILLHSSAGYLERRDAALQLRDVLQLAHARPLRGLPVRQDPAVAAIRKERNQLLIVNSASASSTLPELQGKGRGKKNHLLTRLGSTGAGGVAAAPSPLHSLCASSFSPLSGFSSLKLLWSDGVDELCAGAA